MPTTLLFAADLAEVSPETTIGELLARFGASPATPPVTPKLPPPEAVSELHDIEQRSAVLEQIAADSRQALIDIRTGIDGLRAEIRHHFDAVGQRSEPEQAMRQRHFDAVEHRSAVLEQIAADSRQALIDIRTGIDGLRAEIRHHFDAVDAQPQHSTPEQPPQQQEPTEQQPAQHAVEQPPEQPTVHGCTFEGCGNTTEKPTLNGWAWLCEWGPGVRDGFYCREHVETLEAMLHEGKITGLVGDPPRESRLNDPNAPVRRAEAADNRKPRGRQKSVTPRRRKDARVAARQPTSRGRRRAAPAS